jgi:hypothetical protein
MGIVQREVGVPRTLKQRIRDAAWRRGPGTSSAQLVREKVEAYAAGRPRARARSVDPMEAIKFPIDDAVWAKALARATAEGTSVSEAVRIELEKDMPVES